MPPGSHALSTLPYWTGTDVTAVKEKRPIVLQRNSAAWIALYRTSNTHGNAYWTLVDANVPRRTDSSALGSFLYLNRFFQWMSSA